MENQSAIASNVTTSGDAPKSGRVRISSSYLEWTRRSSRVAGLRLSIRSLVLAAMLAGSGTGLYYNFAPWAAQGSIAYAGPGKSACTLGAYSADSRYLALAYNDKSIRIFETRSGTPVLSLPAQHASIEQLHFSPDGKRLLTSNADDTVCVWDLANGKPVLDMKDLVLLGGFSPDGLSILVRTTTTTRNANGPQEYHENPLVCVFDLSTALYRPIPNTERANTATFTANGRKVVVAQRDGTLRIVDLGGRIIANELGETVTGFSPDGLSLLAGMLNGQGASILDVTSGKIVRMIPGHSGGKLYSAKYSPNGQRIVTSGSDGRVNVWDASNSEATASLDAGPHILAQPGAAFIDNTHVLVPHTDGTASVWINRRPEYQAGVVMLPELWALLIFFAATLWSIARDQSDDFALKRKTAQYVS